MGHDGFLVAQGAVVPQALAKMLMLSDLSSFRQALSVAVQLATSHQQPESLVTSIQVLLVPPETSPFAWFEQGGLQSLDPWTQQLRPPTHDGPEYASLLPASPAVTSRSYSSTSAGHDCQPRGTRAPVVRP